MNSIKPQTLADLNQAFLDQPEGFLVTDSGSPRFAVLPYDRFQSMRKNDKPAKKSGKILVTGGAGYIGSVTVRVLQEQGYEVVVYDNLSTGRKEQVKDCRLIVADLADRESLDRVFREEKFDAVVHFAASLEVEESVYNPAKYFQNNVLNGLNLLDTMTAHGVSKLVFSSSAAVYGEPRELPITETASCQPANPYGETKLIFEKILKWYESAYQLKSVSLRYFNAAGAWPEAGLGYRQNGRPSHLIPRVLDVAIGKMPEIQVFGQDYATPDGTCIRDYIHVLDLARAHVLALEKLSGSCGACVYNVGTGSGHSVLEVIDTAMEITGRMIPMKYAPRRVGDPEKLVACSDKLKNELGWEARFDLSDIIKSSWDWYCQCKAGK